MRLAGIFDHRNRAGDEEPAGKPGISDGEASSNRQVRALCFNVDMYERFLEKWFGVDPARARDHRPPGDPMVGIGAQVKAARVHASLTQRQVEELTGIDQTTISRLENGKSSAMPLDRFAALLRAIDAEIRPIDRPVPAWLAPAIRLDEGHDEGPAPEDSPRPDGTPADPDDDADLDDCSAGLWHRAASADC
jgi:transcriptional regulator with XRE-family HTH domain